MARSAVAIAGGSAATLPTTSRRHLAPRADTAQGRRRIRGPTASLAFPATAPPLPRYAEPAPAAPSQPAGRPGARATCPHGTDRRLRGRWPGPGSPGRPPRRIACRVRTRASRSNANFSAKRSPRRGRGSTPAPDAVELLRAGRPRKDGQAQRAENVAFARLVSECPCQGQGFLQASDGAGEASSWCRASNPRSASASPSRNGRRCGAGSRRSLGLRRWVVVLRQRVNFALRGRFHAPKQAEVRTERCVRVLPGQHCWSVSKRVWSPGPRTSPRARLCGTALPTARGWGEERESTSIARMWAAW